MGARELEKWQVAVCEGLDWKIGYGTFVGGGVAVDLEKYSPAGEDFIFTVSADSFLIDIYRYWRGFDPEEHAKEVSGMKGAPDSLRVLLDDADEIKQMIFDLYKALDCVGNCGEQVDDAVADAKNGVWHEDGGVRKVEGNISDEAVERLKIAD